MQQARRASGATAFHHRAASLQCVALHLQRSSTPLAALPDRRTLDGQTETIEKRNDSAPICLCSAGGRFGISFVEDAACGVRD